jgi:hypothetical protein
LIDFHNKTPPNTIATKITALNASPSNLIVTDITPTFTKTSAKPEKRAAIQNMIHSFKITPTHVEPLARQVVSF